MRRLMLIGFILGGWTVSATASEQTKAQALGAVIVYIGLASSCGDQFPDRDVLANAWADAPLTLEAGGYKADNLDVAIAQAELAAADVASIAPELCKTFIQSIEEKRPGFHQQLQAER